MTTSLADSNERAAATAQPRAAGTSDRRRRNAAFALILLAIVVAATCVRALPLRVDLPYSAYVDEQEVLRPAASMITFTTWKPGRFNYPPLSMYATVAVGALLWALPGGGDVGRAARATVRDPIRANIYSPDLIVAGRIVVLLCAIATIVLVAILTARLRGRRAGLVAGLLAAAMPALLVRSAIVIVDTVATFFTTASLCCASFIAGSRRPAVWAALAGLAAGLAAASKYPAGAVFVAVVVVIAMSSERSARERVTMFGTSIASAAVGAVAGAPTILFQTRLVLRELRNQADIYGSKTTTSYWHELRNPKEVGWLVVLLALAGIVVLLRDRKARPVAVGALVFATVLVGWLGRYSFEPFRNVLPIVPLLCVAAATAIVAIADGAGRRGHFGARATGVLAGVLAVVTSVIMVSAVWSSYLDERVHVHDSRVAAREWLQSRVHAGDDVLVAQELGFLPSELERLRVPAAQRSLARDVSPRTNARYDYVVVGDRPSTRAWLGAISNRRLVASFGFGPTYLSPSSYRQPAQLVRIFAAPGTRDPSRCFPYCG